MKVTFRSEVALRLEQPLGHHCCPAPIQVLGYSPVGREVECLSWQLQFRFKQQMWSLDNRPMRQLPVPTGSSQCLLPPRNSRHFEKHVCAAYEASSPPPRFSAAYQSHKFSIIIGFREALTLHSSLTNRRGCFLEISVGSLGPKRCHLEVPGSPTALAASNQWLHCHKAWSAETRPWSHFILRTWCLVPCPTE